MGATLQHSMCTAKLACSLSQGISASTCSRTHTLTNTSCQLSSYLSLGAAIPVGACESRQGDITTCHAHTGLQIETSGLLEKLPAVILMHMLAPCSSITSAHPTCPSTVARSEYSNLHVETSDRIGCHSLSASFSIPCLQLCVTLFICNNGVHWSAGRDR